MTNELQILTNLGTSAAQIAISEYTTWFFVSALIWSVFGTAIVISSLIFYKKLKDSIDIGAVLPIGLIVIGVLIMGLNVPNLCVPKGYAIHQLLEDVRGK